MKFFLGLEKVQRTVVTYRNNEKGGGGKQRIEIILPWTPPHACFSPVLVSELFEVLSEYLLREIL